MKNETYYLRQMLYRLGIIFLLLSVIRLLFLISNYQSFQVFPAGKILLSFLVGLRFDVSSLLYANALFVILSVFPVRARNQKIYQYCLLAIFLIFNTALLAIEVPDIEYFKFAQRRSGIGEFNLAGDFVRLIPEFLKAYWYLWILFFLLIYAISRVYRMKFYNTAAPQTKWYYQVLIFLVTVGLTVTGMRGGLQLRPITPVGAGVVLKDARLIPLATNTTLNFIFSFQQKALSELHYYPDDELDKRFTLRRNVSDGKAFRPANVVLIILESFGTEYVAKQADGKLYASFFDSLSRQGLRFERSYANAQRSAQGIGSITAGIPALMEEPFHFSPYQSNQVESIASCLKQKSYFSAFFHGSNPGSMDFERFASIAGYDDFFDRSDYGNDRDYDGSWGVWDIPFFTWTAEKLNNFRQPFFCTMFSLNPHSPFKAEKWFEEQHPDDPALMRCVRYTDEALRQFFQQAAKTDWYKNTLFVLCADHTGVPSDENFTTKEGIFRIPVVFYSPDTSIISPKMLANSPYTNLISQIDIMPTVLKLLDYDRDFHCFGEAGIQPGRKMYTYQYTNGLYQILDGEYILLFDGSNIAGMYNYRRDPKMTADKAQEMPEKREELLSLLKAVLQRFNKAMIKNELNR